MTSRKRYDVAKSPATVRFVQQIIHANDKETSNSRFVSPMFGESTVGQ